MPDGAALIRPTYPVGRVSERATRHNELQRLRLRLNHRQRDHIHDTAH